MAVNEWNGACIARCGMVINACPGCRFACRGLCASLGFQPAQGAASLALTLKVQRAKHAINDNFHSLLWKTIKAHWGIAYKEKFNDH